MAAETIAEFLARGGSIEKSSDKISLAELLQKEGILDQDNAEKLAKDLSESLESQLPKTDA